jgi:hypothetical protein
VADENEMTLAEEMSSAANVVPRKGESVDSFVQRIAKALGASSFPEDKWEGMSKDAQDLANDVIQAGTIKKGESKQEFLDRMAEQMPTIPGLEDLMESATVASNGAEDEAPKKRGRPVGSTNKEPKEPKERKPSVQSRGKAILLQHPKMSAKEVQDQLVEEGFTLSPATCTAMRSDFLATLRVLKQEGALKDHIEI